MASPDRAESCNRGCRGQLRPAALAMRAGARASATGTIATTAAIQATPARLGDRIRRGVAPAIRLHRAPGFTEVPLPRTDYARANSKMVRELAR